MLNPGCANTRHLLIKAFAMPKRILVYIVFLAGISGSLLLLYGIKLGLPGKSAAESEESIKTQLMHSDYKAQDPDSGSPKIEASTNEHDAARIPNRDVPETTRNLQEISIIRRVVDAKNASDYFSALTPLSSIDPELAAQRLRHLDDLCANSSLEFGSESVRKRRAEFCAGYAGPRARNNIDLEERLSVNAQMRIEENMRARLTGELSDEAKSDVFSQLVRNAVFPEQIDALISLNAQSNFQQGRPIWQVGSQAQESRYPEADLVNSQTTALLLYRCRRFGGCNYNQYFAIIYCMNWLSGRCKEGASVEEMLFQTTPPAEYNLAREILSKLMLLVS